MKPILAVTIGDTNGVGPEVALKACNDRRVRAACRPVLVGPLDIFRESAKKLKIRGVFNKAVFPALPGGGFVVVDHGDGLWADVSFGTPTKGSGRSAGQALEKAIDLCVNKKVDGMVTAPASKTSLRMAGYDFPGQTELVTLLSRSSSVLMMLVSKKLRVGLVTVHSPLKDVPYQLSPDKISEKLLIMQRALSVDFGVRSPRIAVLGLNPHAGENGHLGSEEKEIIAPAVEHARGKGVTVDGPFPADGFFGSRTYASYDGVLAMYHDQGLVALKLLSFGEAVNVSAGLGIVRTSPDHGTAYDIAGKGKADPSSMMEAILLAASIAKRRRVA